MTVNAQAQANDTVVREVVSRVQGEVDRTQQANPIPAILNNVTTCAEAQNQLGQNVG